MTLRIFLVGAFRQGFCINGFYALRPFCRGYRATQSQKSQTRSCWLVRGRHLRTVGCT